MNNSYNYKIAAVVVTFNRLNLLKQCINSLKNQTYKLNKIIVINNSSTDGTTEWLKDQNENVFKIITQPNSGSAGGQYTGIKSAFENDFDWTWCMDDDALLESNALSEILPYLNSKIRIYNSLVVSKNDRTKLAFGIYDSKRNIYFDEVEMLKGKIFKGSANFFNGTLIPKEFVKDFGLPLKKLFIKGDEYEYYLRALDNQIEVVTIVSSRIYHPPENHFLIDNIFLRYKFSLMGASKRYYSTRNMIILKRTYKHLKHESVIKRTVLDIVFVLIIERSFKNLLSLLRGLFNGLTTDLNKIKN